MVKRVSKQTKRELPYIVRALGDLTDNDGAVGVSDHSSLDGLAGDDHPQYLTTARGDARYIKVGAAPPTDISSLVPDGGAVGDIPRIETGPIVGWHTPSSDGASDTDTVLKSDDDGYLALERLGFGTTSPLTSIHIEDADTGGSVLSTAQILLEDNSIAAMQFLTDNDGSGQIRYSDPDSAFAANFSYNHDGDFFLWEIDSADIFRLEDDDAYLDPVLHVPEIHARDTADLILHADDSITIDTESAGSSAFTAGWTGNGWRILDDSTSNRVSMETDDLVVRGRLSVYELLIQQIRATNGSVFISSGAKMVKADAAPFHPLYFMGSDAEEEMAHGFLENDLIRAQRFTGSGVYVCEGEVTAVTDLYEFELTWDDSTDPPAVGMDFVRIGNTTDADRQGTMYLTSDEDDSPFIDVIDGVDEFSDWGTDAVRKMRIGNLAGLSGLTGWGLTANDDNGATVVLDSGTGFVLTDVNYIAKTGGNEFLRVTPDDGVVITVGGLGAESFDRAYSFTDGNAEFGGTSAAYVDQGASADDSYIYLGTVDALVDINPHVGIRAVTAPSALNPSSRITLDAIAGNSSADITIDSADDTSGESFIILDSWRCEIDASDNIFLDTSDITIHGNAIFLAASDAVDAFAFQQSDGTAAVEIDTNNATVYYYDGSGGQPFGFVNGGISGKVEKTGDDNSFVILNALSSGGSGNCHIRLGRNTDTTADFLVNIYAGNDTTATAARFSGDGGDDSYVTAQGGNFGVNENSPYGKLHVEQDASATEPIQQWTHDGDQIAELEYLDASNDPVFRMATVANGSGNRGPHIDIGRNSDGLGSAGYLVYMNRNGGSYRTWVDGSGDLRVWNSGDPTYANDASGTVVGTQTSAAAAKDILGPGIEPGKALASMLRAPIHRFKYRSGSYNNSEFHGIVTDEMPEFGMDDGRAFSPVTAFGYTVQAIKALCERIEHLEDQIAYGH